MLPAETVGVVTCRDEYSREWFASLSILNVEVKLRPVDSLPMFEIVPYKVVLSPTIVLLGDTAPATTSGSGSTVTDNEFEQLTVRVCPPDDTTTCPVLVPAELYIFETVRVEPERLFVPLHEYVYDPVPPFALALHVADWLVNIEVGDTEHDAESAGVTETVCDAERVPPAPVQVTE